MRLSKHFLRKIIDDSWKEVSFFGGLFFYVFMAAFVFALGQKLLFLQLIVSFAITYALTLLIRFFYYKDRPFKEKYSNFIERLEASSFPSLHSMRVSAMFVILHFYLNNVLFSLLFLSIALAVFASRYYLKKHYPIDILGGAIIGLVVGGIILALPLSYYADFFGPLKIS
jgi:membrane-associated phospholipid phosphatase